MKVELSYREGREIYNKVVLDSILSAQKSVWIATADLKDIQVEIDGRYCSVINLFQTLCDKGVEVRIVHSGIPSRAYLRELKESRLLSMDNFAMKRCPRVHFKAVIVDGRRLYMGSANLTGAGMGAKSEKRRNFEVGIFTLNTEILRELSSLFKVIWDGIMCDGCGRHRVCPCPLEEPE